MPEPGFGQQSDARRCIAGSPGSQLIVLLVIGLVVVAVMGTWSRPLLFASIDPDAAEARGVPVGRLGLLFLVVLALTVTGAAQVVGTLLVLSLAITPAAAQRLSANPLIVLGLSVLFAAVAADGGLLASFQSNVKASVLITSLSFAIYVAARLAGPLLRDRRRRRQHPPQDPPSREAGGFTGGSSTAGRRRPRPTPTLLRDTGREPRGTGRSRG